LISVPAIVSPELWKQAQERRAYNRKIAKRRTKRQYLLRGLIHCACGRVMVGGGKGNLYYCTRRYDPRGSEEPCREPFVKRELIEHITWDYIMKLIRNPQKFEERLREAQAHEMDTLYSKQKEFDHVIALLEDTEMEADIIAREIRKTKGIIRDKLEQQGEEVDKRYLALDKRKNDLLEALAVELTDQTIDHLMHFRETVAIGLENPTSEDRRRWLEILQTTVTVTNGIAVITCRFGGKPLAYRLSEYNISRNWEAN